MYSIHTYEVLLKMPHAHGGEDCMCLHRAVSRKYMLYDESEASLPPQLLTSYSVQAYEHKMSPVSSSGRFLESPSKIFT